MLKGNFSGAGVQRQHQFMSEEWGPWHHHSALAGCSDDGSSSQTWSEEQESEGPF